MNIFFLSLDPETCAQLYCDQHVIKILLEIVQMLYTAWHFSGVDEWNKKAPFTKAGARGYKAAHPNHPMCLWVRSSEEAYTFAVTLGMALAIEYNKRFHKIHACSAHIMWLKLHQPPHLQSKKSEKAYYSIQGIPECMPEEHWDPDIVKAYQSYYKTKTFARFFSKRIV
jgi:hypothetical protein